MLHQIKFTQCTYVFYCTLSSLQPLATEKKFDSLSSVYLSVTSCDTAVSGWCRAGVQITCIAYSGTF